MLTQQEKDWLERRKNLCSRVNFAFMTTPASVMALKAEADVVRGFGPATWTGTSMMPPVFMPSHWNFWPARSRAPLSILKGFPRAPKCAGDMIHGMAADRVICAGPCSGRNKLWRKNMPNDKLRAGLIASVKIAQKDLGLDDTTYRSLLQAVTGQDSAARCTVPQLKAMLAELRAKGWSPRPRNVPQELRPLHAKITALCASLERPLSYADAIIRRQTRDTARLRTASRAQLTACVAALVRQQGREDA